MSYAIITVGGKQYRVQEGERLLVDRLPVEDWGYVPMSEWGDEFEG